MWSSQVSSMHSTFFNKYSVMYSFRNLTSRLTFFCQVLPASAHTVKSTASEFLFNWLFQHEHEHRQWSAAISLGLISSCLHVTDHEQKFQIITGLVEVFAVLDFLENSLSSVLYFKK